jgi:hypothetical protein
MSQHPEREQEKTESPLWERPIYGRCLGHARPLGRRTMPLGRNAAALQPRPWASQPQPSAHAGLLSAAGVARPAWALQPHWRPAPGQASQRQGVVEEAMTCCGRQRRTD